MDPTSFTDLELETWTTLQLCESVNTPRSLAVYLLVRNGEWEQLIDLEWNPANYLDPWHGALDRQVTEILKKSVNLPLGVDREAVAKAAFYAAEHACSETNCRFQLTDYVDHPSWWRRVERRISSILGDLTVDDLQLVVDAGRLGPGSVIGLWKEQWVTSDKFDGVPYICESLESVSEAVLPEAWLDYRPEWNIVRHNKWLSVPKDATKNRGICKSAAGATWYQLGVGELLRGRLLASGIDLRDQGRNRKLASMAWDRGLATIDLSQASDMLAYEVPVRLLPDRWEHLLSLGREEFTRIDGRNYRLAKYCAMGNGYTFPLQTLLFWGVVSAIVPVEQHGLCSCYGDDIICPQKYAMEVIGALEYLGFKVNVKKSFLAGSFFESCGTDWLYGHDVRPFYLRRNEESGSAVPIPYALQIANKLRIWSSRLMGHEGCWRGIRGLWSQLLKLVPRPWVECKVPFSFGDSGVITSLSEARPSRARDGYEGWQIKSVRVAPCVVDKRTPGVLLAALAGMRVRTADITDCISPLKDATVWTYIWKKGLLQPGEKVDIATYGMEPVRGLFGRTRVGVSTTSMWSEGFDWI